MRKILLTLAACGLGLGLTTGTAGAHPERHGRDRGRHERHERHEHHAYYRDHGVHFGGGYYFRGRDHHHWARRVWDAPHHRWIYWEPDLQVYYYWYAPGDCYYPVSYCP